MLNKRIFLYVIQLCLLMCSSTEDIISDNRSINSSHSVLSRRKRYLVFPEGSSLQLVCEYVWPIVGMPNIYVLALSAALAWQLPSKPEHIRYYKNLKKDGDERIDKISENNQLTYQDRNKSGTYYRSKQKYGTDNHKYIPQYHESPTLSLLSPPPVIPLSYSYNNGSWYSSTRYTKKKIYPYKRDQYRKENQKYNTDFYDGSNYFNHPLYVELHRRSRRGLYPKIERFFKAQRKDGKACLLRALCEVSKSHSGKGSFIQEIIKTIFRNKPSQVDEEVDEYDQAAAQDEDEDCSKLYPSCTYN